MAGLCEGGNEPPGSLKVNNSCAREGPRPTRRLLAPRPNAEVEVDDHATRMEEQKKKLTGSLAEKKLPTEGCTENNGERDQSSGQKKIGDDRQH
ncbi:hypothetical protein ANN_26532 [Periplaneta americana]|uniref:Uncharacterized protein n=1 Tax=Periplaneta americana TaxID=6978 RepID=A0ABQ8RYB8_PERAM|nr:hypothetical protein ANN_26532 [Periplaneta americana]